MVVGHIPPPLHIEIGVKNWREMYIGDMLHISGDIIPFMKMAGRGWGNVHVGFLGSLGRALDFEDELGIQFSS